MPVMAREAVFSTWNTARAWSPARLYLLLSGVWLIVVAGMVGFIYNTDFAIDTQPGSSSHIFGVLETNGWHNLAGLLGGLAALGLALNPATARFGALSLGVVYLILTVALVIWEPSTFLIESNLADNVVHGLLGIAGVASAIATRSTRGPPSVPHED